MTPKAGLRESATSRQALVWLGLYLAAVTLPLFAFLPGPEAGNGLRWDFATGPHANTVVRNVDKSLLIDVAGHCRVGCIGPEA